MTRSQMHRQGRTLPSDRASSSSLAAIILLLVVALGWIAPVFAQTTATVTTTATQGSGAAAVSLSPSSDSSNALVEVSGSGFLAGRNVTVIYDGNQVAFSGTCRTDSTGLIPGCNFRVPASSSGAHHVLVTDGTNSASSTFTVPSISIPESTYLVTLTSVTLGLVTQLATRKLVDLNAERRMKAEVAAFNKEKREATLANDKARLEKIKKRELPMRQAQTKVSTARLKVTAVTFVPLLGVYYLMANFLGGFNVAVAHSPIPIPFLVGPTGAMVLFWWYLISSFTASSLLTKLLHTTT
ncbi:MAG: EMC3/TMCO1 family protein [Candidatus Gagatemarchaeaceae archaeon]